MDVTQGKITIGLDLHLDNEEQKYDAMVYNAILGGTANSKMFQEVREKASLAYSAGSSYVRYKSNIFIKCGIEIKNYEKAMEIIRKQLEDMKNGVFSDEDIECVIERHCSLLTIGCSYKYELIKRIGNCYFVN